MFIFAVGGQLCLQCRNVVDPGACNTVTTCGTHEVRYTCSRTKPHDIVKHSRYT